VSIAMFFGAGFGYVGGVVASLFIGRRIVGVILRSAPFDREKRRTIVRAAAAGGFIALLPALVVGTVVGGTLGGAYGEFFSSSIGGGSAVVVLGIALGMFAVVALIMCIAIGVGAYVGRLVARRRLTP
jgi:hypothetical protein